MADTSVIALDVGGTSVKSAVVGLAGRIIGQPTVTPLDSRTDAETILAAFAGIIQHHLGLINPVCLLGVAFGFPGPFDYEAGISYITGVAKYEAIYGLNIKSDLQSRLGRPMLRLAFRNDAEAAIAGEARYGAGQPYRRLIGVTLGTGLGSAFIIDGVRIVSSAGIPPDGWLYPIPFRAVPADDVFSRRGLAHRLQAAGSTILEAKDAAIAAREGDTTIRQVFEIFGTDLGDFLEPFAASFQAEAVLILGGIAGAFDLFGPALNQTLSVPALPGQCGPEAALLGAAEMLFMTK